MLLLVTGGSLAHSLVLLVVAAPERRASTNPLELIQGSLSAGRIARRSPLLGGMHRLMDGTLLGVVAAVAVLSGLTLHWQHRWTLAFNLLESTRTQAHRLTESTAQLEQYFLLGASQPASLVPTQAANLVHLDRPSAIKAEPSPPPMFGSLDGLLDQPIRAGY